MRGAEDEGVLATGSADQTVKLFDFSTGRALAAEHAHCAAVRSVAFSADGKTLVSGGDDGILMVWNVEAGRWWFVSRDKSLSF